jgi:RHS repeat-associated protein
MPQTLFASLFTISLRRGCASMRVRIRKAFLEKIIVAIAAIVGLSALGFAQTTVGIQPFGSYTSNVDQVNLSDLGIHIQIPLFQHHARGAGMGVNVNLVYDSGRAGWSAAGNQAPLSVGWSSGSATSVPESVQVFTTQTGFDPTLCHWVWNYRFTDQTGYTHSFAPVQANSCSFNPQGRPTSQTLDGYALSATGNNAVVTAPSGVRFGSVISTNRSADAVDTNGNIALIGVHAVDSSGLQMAYPYTLTDDSGTKVVLNDEGYHDGSPYVPGSPFTVQYTDTSGQSQTITVNYKIYPIWFTCPIGAGHPGYQQSEKGIMIDSIVYPDGTSYSFTYTGSGALQSITFPTGGTVTYSGHQGAEASCGSLWPSTVVRTTTDGSTTYTRTIDAVWSPTDNTPTESTTHIASPAGNETTHFVLNWGAGGTPLLLETAHTWANTAGTTLKSTMRCYNGSTGNCTTTPITGPVTKIATTTTLDNGKASQVVETLNTSSLPTEIDEYDFGATAPTRKSVTVYASLGNNIQDRPQTVTVYDGSGNIQSQTSYAYDDYSLAASGVSGLAAITGSRGNLTTVTSMVSGSSTVSTHSHYDDAGQVVTSTDINQGTTTYGHDATDTYITSKTYPPVVAGAFSESYTPDSDTGLITQSKDVNGNITNYKFDAMLRPVETDHPDGGVTKWTYAANPTTVTTSVSQSATVSYVTAVQFDGYGRKSRSAVANGQSGSSYYQLDTCYDANGNVAFTSYPYQSTGFGAPKICSGSGDKYAYDALGRVTSVTHGNGESRSSSYTGSATQSVDENGVTRISQLDSFARPTIVCEISSNSSMPGSGSPVSCGADIAGTGFATTYAHDPANHKTTITQGAQTRIFQTDGLGRPTLVQEPESGQTTYSYAFNSTGLVETRQRPKANQTSGAVLTTTTTQHDSLGRVLTISYSDGTPTKSYTYDQSAGANFTGFAQSNLKGNLSRASTPAASTAYNYDAMKRVVGMAECLPGYCGTVADNKLLSYKYDLAGNLTSSSDGAGVTTSYSYSPANEVQHITSSFSDATHPATLVSSVQNGPNGPISYTLGNGRSQFNSYDTLGRVSGGWVCPTTPANNCSGQVYGFSTNWHGTQLKGSSDDVTGAGITYGYDSFNRLTSMSNASGQLYTYIYDRYGNRWAQTPLQGGFTFSQAFNTANNQLYGFTYDAAGNLVSDGINTYTYDADGNLTQEVSSGSTAQYVYDALNQQVSANLLTYNTSVYDVFDQSGQLASSWSPTPSTQVLGKAYWGSTAIESYSPRDNMAYFAHRDWVGTRRAITNATGATTNVRTSLPFGDGATNVSGSRDNTFDGFTGMWDGGSTATNHAQFREYWNVAGRWLQPDRYSGSYDFSNPQSLNRYAYVLNNPIGAIDPLGLECVWDNGSFDAADDPYTAAADSNGGHSNCTNDGGTWVDPNLFEGVEGNQYGSWSDQASSSIGFDWLTPSAIVNGNTPWTFTDFQAMYQAWNTGILPQQLNYGPWSVESIDMSHNWAVNQARAAYIKAGCPASYGFNSGHMGAAVDSWGNVVLGQPDWLELQVGGFSGTITGSGGDAQFTLNNPMSESSFSGESAFKGTHTGDNPNGPNGPRHNVQQTFKWSEQGLCQ